MAAPRLTKPCPCDRFKGRMKKTISLLSFWTLPTTARLTVDTVPPLAAEGSVAVFNILEKEGLIIGYGWFRGNRIDQRAAIEAYQIINNSHTPGPSHTGRETIKPNGSLVIQSVKKQDAGTYTMITVKADLTNVSASGQLQVYSLLQQPSIQVSDPMVREKENKVVMTCITNEMDITIKWIFNKKQLKSAKNIFLSEDSENLTIDPIKKENAGDYQCEISNIGTSNRSETFELKVKGKPSPQTVHPLEQAPAGRVDTNATTKGSAHSGRETLYPNGTLLIQNVIQKDTGSYTLLVAKNDLETERQIGHLCVYYGPAAPTTSFSDSCYHPEENLTSPATQDSWLVNAKPQKYAQVLFIPNHSVYSQIQHYLTGLDSTTPQWHGPPSKPATPQSQNMRVLWS
ncbi:hypothetical protein E5288_WYG016552 [Bos mutus]|uniref:Ig-like domain-containing protein n=1 Tax=Bos mutus TaxID=72004 RepID=A0A6B0S3K5_9CETA|nr:hypothetical protein [Bos mutus]